MNLPPALRLAPLLLLALAGLSSAAVLVRLAAAPASVTAFWRLTLSLLLVAPLALAGGGPRQLGALGRGDAGWLVLSGVCLALHFYTWFLSLAYTTVAASTVLVTSHPALVGLLSARLLGEPPGREAWLGIGLAILGAAIVGWGDLAGGPAPLLGDGLALLAAGFVAVYYVAGRRLRRRLGLWSYVAPAYGAAAVLTLGIAVVEGAPLSGYPTGTWAAFAGLAVGPMLLGHTGFNWALRHVRAYVVSVIQLLEPVGATLLAVVVLGAGERPGIGTVGGGALILIGAWLAAHRGAASRSPAEGGGS